MTAATFAIAGIPPFAGFFSKDEILVASLFQPSRQLGLLVHRRVHRFSDFFLHVPAVVLDLLRRVSRSSGGGHGMPNTPVMAYIADGTHR